MRKDIHVGSRVRHNNMICTVLSISGNSCELQPPRSHTIRYSAPLSDVMLILNEGSSPDDNPHNIMLYD